MIPDKNNQEWYDLVTGNRTWKLKNFVLQMKVNQSIKSIKENRATPKEMINQIYDLCSKYEVAVKSDMTTIFGEKF